MRLLGYKLFVPQLQRSGVVLAKRKLVHHIKTSPGRLRAKLLGAWQAATGKDVLLNKVSRCEVTLKQRIGDHDALDTRITAGFKQAVYGLEILWPILAAYGFDHLNRTDRIKRLVGSGFADIAVVLQT